MNFNFKSLIHVNYWDFFYFFKLFIKTNGNNVNFLIYFLIFFFLRLLVKINTDIYHLFFIYFFIIYTSIIGKIDANYKIFTSV